MSRRAKLSDPIPTDPLLAERRQYFLSYCAGHRLTPTDDLYDLFLEGTAWTATRVQDILMQMGVRALMVQLFRRNPRRRLTNLFGLLG